MKVQSRRELISKLVNEQGFASLEFLAEKCGVSTQTIRRDLQALCDDNMITRHHGGASPNSSLLNTSYDVRRISLLPEKRELAAEAVRQIAPNRMLFLSAGSTMEVVAQELKKLSSICVLTNNLHAAIHLYREENIDLFMSCGQVRKSNGGIVGTNSIDFVSNFRVDYMIMGIGAISPDGLLLEYDYNEGLLMRRMMQNANKVILVTDSTKYERNATVKVAHLSDVDILVTDQEPPVAIADICSSNNVRVVIPHGMHEDK